MIHKNALYAIDKTLQDLRRNRRLMGGVPVLLAGDFRQTLPIISKGTPADEVSACLRKSDFWKNVESRRLTTNMRARLQNAPTIAEFSRTLLAIGNGSIAADANGMIDMTTIGECVNNTNELFDKVYPDLATNVHDIDVNIVFLIFRIYSLLFVYIVRLATFVSRIHTELCTECYDFDLQ